MAKTTIKESKSILEADVSLGGVNFTQRAIFAKHLSVMLRAGLTVSEAVHIAGDSSKGALKKILNKVLKSVNAGNSLSDSLARFPKVFEGLFVTSVYAGEQSGTLVENLEEVSVQLEKEKELILKIKGAMIYPVIVLVATFILGLTLAFLILPKITGLLKGLKVELPFTTRVLIQFSELVENHGLLLFIGIIGSVTAIYFLARSKMMRPVMHKIMLKTPIIRNVSKGANLTRFCRTTGTLLKSGLTLSEALDVAKVTLNNYHYQKAVEKASKGVRTGSKLSDLLAANEDMFPLIVTRMIGVGEESGNLEDSLIYLSDFYEKEVDEATKTLSTAIEPALLIFIGLFVGFLALSIITPIYDITGNIQR